MSLNDRILDILRRRGSFAQPMAYSALWEACRHNGLLPEQDEYDKALHALCDADLLDATWSRNGPGKMQAAYTATSRRTTNDTPNLEPDNGTC